MKIKKSNYDNNVFNEKQSKFSIIIPTYNDAKTIESTINSIKIQTYKKWEVIIIDDGSTDNTKKVLEKYIYDKKIKCFHQENSDQLNAVLYATQHITGDYVLILHSDDVLANDDVLERSYYYFNNNDCDAIIGNLQIMDDNEKFIRIQKTSCYKNKDYIKALQLLWLGRNLYVDTAIFKKDFFLNEVKENYLTWNMPFWLSYKPNPTIENVHNVNFSLIRYRIFAGNYINNELGKLNVINGELRTAIILMKYYSIPCFKIQYFCFRIFNKLRLLSFYRPIFLRSETKNKSKIVDYILNKRLNNFKDYLYLDALSNFYKYSNNRKIKLNFNNTFVYYGKDIRLFNKKMLNNELEYIYNYILNEMKLGFKTILIKKEDYQNLVITLKFLAIYNDIDIEVI